MAHVIEMPKLSDTMEEGAIARWLKKEGEKVKEGEPLVEIETDKATQEYEAPEGGVLLKLLVQPGKAVALRTPIAVIGAAGEAVDLSSLLGASKGATTKAAAPAAVAAAPVPTVASPVKGVPVGDSRLRSSPLARKVAAERGLDLAAISGSGPAGRIVLRDLEHAVPSAGEAVHGGSALPSRGATSEPLSMMRKTIAKRLAAAKNDAPHFYLTVSADVGRLESWRKAMNDEAAAAKAADLAKVSLNDLVIMAVARALRLHKSVNSSWQGDSILVHHDVHVAMAVALPSGLVTPVIRNTDALGARAIAERSRKLAQLAKDGKLGNDDFAGGTFTISNLGMFGIEDFTAIINPPQAAILAVGAAVPTPWVNAAGAVVVQPRMKMTLSCDHRVVDGAMGAQFLRTLVTYLEDPLRMMA